MRHGSLFSGIGGFELAAEWMGWENVFHCEKEPFCRKVLNHYWPESISYTDIKTTDFKIHENTIDIISGGFPCQPYSTAGKRLGKEDDRHLWPFMLRAIREISPRWVVGENVRGLISWNGGMVFDEVQADLEAEGYEVLPFLLPACAVNAPHRRDRVWFIAYSNSNGGGRHYSTSEIDYRRVQKRLEEEYELDALHGDGITANTNDEGIQGRQASENTEKERQEAVKFIRGYYQRNDWRMFPTVSPIRLRDDGLSAYLDTAAISEKDWTEGSIKSTGNAVVPQVVYEIFKAIELFESATEAPQS